MEEALHDTPLCCEFAGLDAAITRLPDESTILRLHHLLTMVRYKGLTKNTAQMVALFALSNLWMAKRQILHRALG